MKKMVLGLVVLLGVAAAAPQPIQAPVQRGKAIYEQTCLPCHQAASKQNPGQQDQGGHGSPEGEIKG